MEDDFPSAVRIFQGFGVPITKVRLSSSWVPEPRHKWARYKAQGQLIMDIDRLYVQRGLSYLSGTRVLSLQAEKKVAERKRRSALIQSCCFFQTVSSLLSKLLGCVPHKKKAGLKRKI